MSYLTHSLGPRIEYAPRPAGIREKRRRPGTVARTLLGTVREGAASNSGVDDDERQALQAEGLDPNDPAVIAAIDLV